jgi:hypothetical protein
MRLSIKSGIFLIPFLLAAHCASALSVPTTVSVRGDVQKPGEWSVGALKQRFAGQIQTVKFTAGDQQPRVGTGIPLYSLIQEATPKVEKAPKHYDLSFLVILEARDGYRVFFSLAELTPQCGNAQVWLVWEVDGKPLSDKEAPFRLAVLSDQGHDRCIYGIATMTLVDGTKLANRLGGRQ